MINAWICGGIPCLPNFGNSQMKKFTTRDNKLVLSFAIF